MNDIVSKEQNDNAKKMRDLLSVYYANYDLISIGAYKKGTNLKLDEAISKIDMVNNFLMQRVDDKFTYDDVLELMNEI
ncbi:hypothetical protein SDC9_67831 [bioreactor metagenome]